MNRNVIILELNSGLGVDVLEDIKGDGEHGVNVPGLTCKVEDNTIKVFFEEKRIVPKKITIWPYDYRKFS